VATYADAGNLPDLPTVAHPGGAGRFLEQGPFARHVRRMRAVYQGSGTGTRLNDGSLAVNASLDG
jgi:hypothetical protein